MTMAMIPKRIITLTVLGALVSCGRVETSQIKSVYAGSNFRDVWSTIKQNPYPEGQLPDYQTSNSKFFDGSVNLLQRAVNRTLSDQSDLLPRFQKLVHPIGICFAGTWTITEDNSYTGYFAKGSRGQIIMRASEAMGNPTADNWRGFGLAGKIFPTADAQDPGLYKTANFFTVDDLGGTDSESFLDLPKTNKPASTFHVGSIALLPTIHTIAKVFSSADSNPTVRQLYPISQLGMTNSASSATPTDFMLKSENTERNGLADFRDELRLKNFPGGLVFGIYTSDPSHPSPRKIGKIHLTDEALSDSCDHRLHFQHPLNR